MYSQFTKLIQNKAQCRVCLDTIESKSGHDFKSCKCGEISVDGGLGYLRRLFKDRNNIIELSEYRYFNEYETIGEIVYLKPLAQQERSEESISRYYRERLEQAKLFYMALQSGNLPPISQE